MNGIAARFTATIIKSVPRTARGRPWASFTVLVDDDQHGTVVRCSMADPPLIVKGAAVYIEGRLTLRPWTDADGKARAGLSLTAWLVQPLGQIGRKA